MTFAPGAANVAGGKPRNNRFRAAIRRHLNAHPDKLDAIAQALVASAAAGDISAIREFADRLDGKATQRNELTGANGAALVVEIVKFGNSD